jgi:hypothetical protein
MEFQLPITLAPLTPPIRYGEKILLTGSCFTEHIGNQLNDWKFDVLQNPHGILFDPASVASALISYIQNRSYGEEDLVFFHELWQSWQHHSHFSDIDKEEALRAMNASQSRAHGFLKEAKWLIITLGSAFSYRLSPDAPAGFRPTGQTLSAGPTATSYPVANCHRAPAQVFDKHLMTIEEINAALDNCLYQLFRFNPDIHVIFTVSPVRHIRDGVVDNNRSKARLTESVHHLAGKFHRIFYFPAYELVIDVLRDYRFYDVDMVHPNYPATQFVLEKFTRYCIDEASQRILEEVKKIVIARRHKPFQPATMAHRRFLQDHWQKTKDLLEKYPFLRLEEELGYFSSGISS